MSLELFPPFKLKNKDLELIEMISRALLELSEGKHSLIFEQFYGKID